MNVLNYDNFILEVLKSITFDINRNQVVTVINSVNDIFRDNGNYGMINITHKNHSYDVSYKIIPNTVSLNIIDDILNYMIGHSYFEIGHAIHTTGDYEEIPSIMYFKSINHLNELLKYHNIPRRILQYDGTYELINFI